MILYENGREKLSGAWPLELAAPALELTSTLEVELGTVLRRLDKTGAEEHEVSCGARRRSQAASRHAAIQ